MHRGVAHLVKAHEGMRYDLTCLPADQDPQHQAGQDHQGQGVIKAKPPDPERKPSAVGRTEGYKKQNPKHKYQKIKKSEETVLSTGSSLLLGHASE